MLFTTAAGINDLKAANGQIVDDKKQQSHRGGGDEKPRRALGKFLHHGGQLEYEEDERVHKPHHHGAQPQLCEHTQRAAADRLKPWPQQGIIAEKAENEGRFLVCAEKKAEDRRGGKAAPRIARAAFLARGQQRGGGEDRPDVGGQRQDAAEPQKGDGERAEHAAERQLMRFLCHITDIRAPSRRGARW